MKVLILRTAPFGQYKKLLYSMLQRGDAENYEIYTLTSSGSEEACKKIFLPKVFYTYKGKRLTLFSLGVKNIFRLRREKFDRVVIMYANYLGEGYGNVRSVVSMIRPKFVEEWNLAGYVHTYTWREFVSLPIKERLFFMKCLFVWIFLFIFSGRKDKV